MKSIVGFPYLETTPRGKLVIAILFGLGFSALFFSDLVLFLIFIGFLISILGEFAWIIIVSLRPDRFFKIEGANQTKHVALGEGVQEEFNFRVRAKTRTRLSSEIPYLKIIPEEFEKSGNVRFEFRSPFTGTYRPENFQVHFEGPLKLFRADSKIGTNLSYVVYPRIYDVALQTTKILGKSGIGEFPTELPGIGTEFYDMRQYEQGDDIRSVNWKASARLGKLIVNERSREVGARYYLVLEANPTSYFDRDRLASAFLQIGNFLAILGVNYGVLVHDGRKVSAFKEIDAATHSLSFTLASALDFAEVGSADILKPEIVTPLPSHVIKSTSDSLSKAGLTLLSEIETLGKLQMITGLESNDAFKTIVEKLRQNPSEPPAILYLCELSSSKMIAQIIEASSEIKRAFNADFIVIDPTAPWVAAKDEERAAEIYETFSKRLKILGNSQVQYHVGDPLKVAEQVFT